MTDSLQALLTHAGLDDSGDWPRFLVYLLAALSCAYLGYSSSLAERTTHKLQQLWLMLCTLYLLAAVNALMRGDVLWVQWARSFFLTQHSYGGRRPIQMAVLLVLLVLFAASWKRLQGAHAFSLRTLLLVGGGGTLVLHLLRYVSFHYTDLALGALWLGHSVASWMEAVFLGLVAVGTGLELLRSRGHV